MKNTLCGLLLAGLCGLTVNTHAAGLGDALRGQIGGAGGMLFGLDEMGHGLGGRGNGDERQRQRKLRQQATDQLTVLRLPVDNQDAGIGFVGQIWGISPCVPLHLPLRL